MRFGIAGGMAEDGADGNPWVVSLPLIRMFALGDPIDSMYSQEEQIKHCGTDGGMAAGGADGNLWVALLNRHRSQYVGDQTGLMYLRAEAIK